MKVIKFVGLSVVTSVLVIAVLFANNTKHQASAAAGGNQDKFFVSDDNRTISLEGKQLVRYIEAHFGSNHIDSYT